MTPAPDHSATPRHWRVVAVCVGVVALMTGASFAAVPLYDMFCRVTGYGGTTQVAKAAPGAALERTVTVRFDGNVAPGLGWRFAPETNTMTVKVGETKLALYKAKNTSDRPITGTATYNVAPNQTGAYFSKLQCFCFTEQTLQPGEEIEMPVAFFVDPSIADNAELNDVDEITLSYTFFPAKSQKPSQKSASAAAPERPKS